MIYICAVVSISVLIKYHYITLSLSNKTITFGHPYQPPWWCMIIQDPIRLASLSRSLLSVCGIRVLCHFRKNDLMHIVSFFTSLTFHVPCGAHVVFKQGIWSSILNEWCSKSRGYKQDTLSTFMLELMLNSWHALTKLLRNRVNKLIRCWIFTIVVPKPELRIPIDWLIDWLILFTYDGLTRKNYNRLSCWRGRSDLSAAPSCDSKWSLRTLNWYHDLTLPDPFYTHKTC